MYINRNIIDSNRPHFLKYQYVIYISIQEIQKYYIQNSLFNWKEQFFISATGDTFSITHHLSAVVCKLDDVNDKLEEVRIFQGLSLIIRNLFIYLREPSASHLRHLVPTPSHLIAYLRWRWECYVHVVGRRSRGRVVRGNLVILITNNFQIRSIYLDYDQIQLIRVRFKMNVTLNLSPADL